MAFYKSKYTGTEIDQRLAQATYDDAVLAGFKGSKEEFDAILGKLKEISNSAAASQPAESDQLETFNKNIIGAINELHRELQTKPDEKDVIDQEELDVFKDEIAAKYATKEELEKIVDSDELLSGAGINIREEDGKKIVNVADDTLTKIQYSDSEVRRLETAKIPYAYDEKTQSNINVILPEGGSYLGNYGDENATIAKAAVYDGVKQLELGSSKVHTNINTDSDVTIETSNGKKVIATTDQIPDVSGLATKEELINKVDWIDYNNTKNIVLPSNGQVFGDFGGEESNSSLLGARIYNAGLENEEKQVEVGTSKVHLNLNSLDKPTIETPDGKENLVVESDIELMPIEVNFPVRTSGGSDGPEDRVYTQEEILEWFGVADIAALKKQIANKGIQYIKYGIMLMGNPYYYRMPIEYIAFESANQIKLVFIGLNTNNDIVSKYEIIINLDGTIIEGNSNVKVTITSIESGDIDLSVPYKINLTNLLSAEDSELISTAIGGIDNLKATVQNNRIIVGTISNGSVSVSIRILGNVTTLYYLLDSVVGLTLNEIAITNTSGTLSKKVTTHSVLTENMVINSLESNEATLPLSAAQGKVLATDKQNKTDNNLSTTNKTIVGAINELLAKVQELETKNTELKSRLAALEGSN